MASVGEDLRKLIPRLASEFDGEVVATVRAIQRILRSHKFDLHDLSIAVQLGFDPGRVEKPSEEPELNGWPVPPKTKWRKLVDSLLAEAVLTNWERDFCKGLVERQSRRVELSPKQQAVIMSILDKQKAKTWDDVTI